MAVRPDAFNRKLKNRPAKANLNDDRIRNRKRTMLLPEVINDIVRADVNRIFRFTPIDVILFAAERSMDKFINVAYNINKLAQIIVAALRNKYVYN